LDTAEHGLPQNRSRWYCVGILKDVDTGSFDFPAPIKGLTMDQIISASGDAQQKGSVDDLPKTAKANVEYAFRKIRKSGMSPEKETFIIDCDASDNESRYYKKPFSLHNAISQQRPFHFTPSKKI